MRPYTLPHGLRLLYEDRELLVVTKPSGLLTIAAGAANDRTVYWILSEYLRRKGEKRRAAVVHRLDRDSSGVLLFAKSEEAKRRLMKNWNENVTERVYIALAEGRFPEESGLIDQPLGEDRNGKMIVLFNGVTARTRWRVIGEGKKHSLLKVELETGRRNQIRAHLSWFQHPVAGDRKYGAATDPLGRLCLHAESLAFHHPMTGAELRFEVSAPPEFSRFLYHKKQNYPSP